MALEPLEGTRVLDVTTSIAGPYCAQILAALGADVVKVERPDTGDDGRAWGPPFWDGEGTMFLSSNAGKRSLGALAARSTRARGAAPAGRPGRRLPPEPPAGARRRARSRRGRAPRAERAPRLLLARRLRPHGAAGARARLRRAACRRRAASSRSRGSPGGRESASGSSLIDQGTGTWAALGVVAALLEREQTGEGSVVDVSLYETASGYVGYHVAGYLADGTVPSGDGTRFPMVAPYQVFPTRDGELMLGGGNDRLFRAICAELGAAGARRRSPLRDERRPRAESRRARGLLEARLRLEDTATWQERFARAGVPAAPVADVKDVAESPQTEALGILQRLDHPRIPESDPRRAPAELRRRASAAPERAARRRRALGRDPARGRATRTTRSPRSRQQV